MLINVLSDIIKMINTGSLSPSDHKFVCIIIYSLLLILNSTNAQAFDFLLRQLPQFWGFNNFFQSRIVLNVKDYGAIGDGIEDDTKVIDLVTVVFSSPGVC